MVEKSQVSSGNEKEGKNAIFKSGPDMYNYFTCMFLVLRASLFTRGGRVWYGAVTRVVLVEFN